MSSVIKTTTRTNRKNKLKSTYNIKPEEVVRIVKLENECCPGCKNEFTLGEDEYYYDKTGKAVVVDHDHETGNVRGVLCSTCNVALGMAKDNPHTLINLAEYLTKSEGFYVAGGQILKKKPMKVINIQLELFKEY